MAALSLKAGVDMDMVGELFLKALKSNLERGTVTEEKLNTACCRRVLEAKYKLGLFEDPCRYINLSLHQSRSVAKRP